MLKLDFKRQEHCCPGRHDISLDETLLFPPKKTSLDSFDFCCIYIYIYREEIAFLLRARSKFRKKQ